MEGSLCYMMQTVFSMVLKLPYCEWISQKHMFTTSTLQAQKQSSISNDVCEITYSTVKPPLPAKYEYEIADELVKQDFNLICCLQNKRLLIYFQASLIFCFQNSRPIKTMWFFFLSTYHIVLTSTSETCKKKSSIYYDKIHLDYVFLITSSVPSYNPRIKEQFGLEVTLRITQFQSPNNG